jgi:hypothetical protein
MVEGKMKQKGTVFTFGLFTTVTKDGQRVPKVAETEGPLF